LDGPSLDLSDSAHEQKPLFWGRHPCGQRVCFFSAHSAAWRPYLWSDVGPPVSYGEQEPFQILLQASVVALGFGMNLHEVLHAGQSGFVYTALSITGAMLLGLGLGYLIHVQKKPSFLISAGTAICGGSAIAAVGPIAEANEEEMAVSLGTVFILNSVALFLFPVIGLALHMSQTQFGLWSALAIHDTSSVVGATAKYGAAALAVGTTIKLARALWIVPLSAVTAIFLKSKARIQWPWFILFFCFAALLNTLLPSYSGAFGALNHLGRIGLTVTLFLIGTGLNKKRSPRWVFVPCCRA